MFRLPKTPSRRRSRGQSLVEFAVVLPIMLLLTLIALDFGRVYLGYINLQSMARVAANYAANEPDAWGATPDMAVQTKYKNQILADAAATNCALPKVGGVTTVPPPTFTDTNGDGIGLGDAAKVGISCTFGVVTPFISNILGGNVAVSADSTFPVKSGMSATGGGGGSAPNAAFSGNGEIASRLAPGSISGVAPFQVDFRDTSGGNPTSWAWTFSPGGTFPDRNPATSSIEQDPGLVTFVGLGPHTVSMTATNLYGSTTATMIVTVTGSTVNFTADKTSGNEPLTVVFTDASTAGGTAYDWTFGSGEGTGTGTSQTHTYTTPGTYTVSLTVTYPTGPLTETKLGFITVSASCTVPKLNGGAVRFNDAEGIWRGAPYNFTGIVIRGTGAPSGNFFITTQSLVADDKAPCNSDVTVNRP